MPIYRTFSYIEEYIVSNLPYRVSRYSQNQWFFCLFRRKFQKFSENSENSPKIQKTHEPKSSTTTTAPKIPKIRQKFWKFSENSPKIPQKEGLLWGPHIVSYRIVSRKKPSYRIDIVSSRKKSLSLFIGQPWILWAAKCAQSSNINILVKCCLSQFGSVLGIQPGPRRWEPGVLATGPYHSH